MYSIFITYLWKANIIVFLLQKASKKDFFFITFLSDFNVAVFSFHHHHRIIIIVIIIIIITFININYFFSMISGIFILIRYF